MEIHSSKILWRWCDVYDSVLLEEPGTKNKRGTQNSVCESWTLTQRIMIMHWGILSGEQTLTLVLFEQARQGDILDSVLPGEVTDVQVAAKCASNPAVGHWSRWSEPARAMVPQSSGMKKNGEGKGNICNPAAHHGAQCRCDGFKPVCFVVQVRFHWRASHLTCTTSPARGTEPGTAQRMITRFSTSRAWGLWFIT